MTKDKTDITWKRNPKKLSKNTLEIYRADAQECARQHWNMTRVKELFDHIDFLEDWIRSIDLNPPQFDKEEAIDEIRRT